MLWYNRNGSFYDYLATVTELHLESLYVEQINQSGNTYQNGRVVQSGNLVNSFSGSNFYGDVNCPNIYVSSNVNCGNVSCSNTTVTGVVTCHDIEQSGVLQQTGTGTNTLKDTHVDNIIQDGNHVISQTGTGTNTLKDTHVDNIIQDGNHVISQTGTGTNTLKDCSIGSITQSGIGYNTFNTSNFIGAVDCPIANITGSLAVAGAVNIAGVAGTTVLTVGTGNTLIKDMTCDGIVCNNNISCNNVNASDKVSCAESDCHYLNCDTSSTLQECFVLGDLKPKQIVQGNLEKIYQTGSGTNTLKTSNFVGNVGISGSLTCSNVIGNASTSSVGSKITVSNNSSNVNYNVPFVSTASGDASVYTDGQMIYNPYYNCLLTSNIGGVWLIDGTNTGSFNALIPLFTSQSNLSDINNQSALVFNKQVSSVQAAGSYQDPFNNVDKIDTIIVYPAWGIVGYRDSGYSGTVEINFKNNYGFPVFVDCLDNVLSSCRIYCNDQLM